MTTIIKYEIGNMLTNLFSCRYTQETLLIIEKSVILQRIHMTIVTSSTMSLRLKEKTRWMFGYRSAGLQGCDCNPDTFGRSST